jgi:hypothetical protein
MVSGRFEKGKVMKKWGQWQKIVVFRTFFVCLGYKKNTTFLRQNLNFFRYFYEQLKYKLFMHLFTCTFFKYLHSYLFTYSILLILTLHNCKLYFLKTLNNIHHLYNDL